MPGRYYSLLHTHTTQVYVKQHNQRDTGEKRTNLDSTDVAYGFFFPSVQTFGAIEGTEPIGFPVGRNDQNVDVSKSSLIFKEF